MSSKRGEMSRKRPTQVELERENSELKKQVKQLQKRLKQALRQLKKEDDIEIDNQVALDLEAEASFQDMLEGKKPDEDADRDYFTVTLPNGHVKKILRRVTNQ
jgi:hypothetical protein